MVSAALYTPLLPFLLAAGTLAALGLLWCVLFPPLAIGALYTTLIVGQAVRVPLWGQSGGLLISDVAVVIVLIVAAVQSWHKQKVPTVARLVLLCSLPFIGWSLWGLLVNPLGLPWADLRVAAAYWLRLSCYLLLTPALVVLCASRARAAATWFLCTLVIVALGGFVQLWILPRVAVLAGGWDPHEGRLVSTWLDPNLFGGLLAVALPWAFGFALQYRFVTRRPYLSGLVAIVLISALILTKSRSSLLALALGTMLVTPCILRYWSPRDTARRNLRLSALALLLGLIASVALLALGERAWGVVVGDPTVALRLSALQEVWHLAAAHSLWGVGYNAYQFAAQEAGLIADFSLHSRAGADNSLVTLWVTTGLPGILLFTLPWVAAGHWLWRRYRYAPALAGGALTALLVWYIHGQFVNSLLYGHLLIAVAAIVALSSAAIAEEKSHGV